MSEPFVRISEILQSGGWVIPDADPEDRRTRSVFQIDWDFSDTA